ncbi:MAG: flagellar basal body-associated FliL family protein [Phyllobacterium sp.]|uniref:flagellar basal body-associated FliL family protein n=1 Tax=Phyllobacterium sp. TaxID=1871046 RepID=UPI0030F0EEB0
MSAVAEEPALAPKGPSLIALVAVVVILTLIAAGGGWFLGGKLGLAKQEAAETPAEVSRKPQPEDMPAGTVVPLKPILTNVKIPQNVWLRMEAGVVARPGEKIADELAATITGDFMAFLRTVNLMQLRGPAGLEYLRTDLEERAKMRSEGKIDKVYIWALVME